MKILVILPRFPFPLEKGDKLRAYHQIKGLSGQHEIYLFALSHRRVPDSAIAEMQCYCKEIRIARLHTLAACMRVLRNFLFVKSLQIGFWDSSSAQKQLHRFADEIQPDVVYAQMIRTLKYAAHLSFPKVLDFQDALSMNTERRMMHYRGLRYFVLHYEFKMLRSAEFNACGIFDAMTIISQTDRDAVPQRHDTAISIVRNGVDFNYFHPIIQPQQYDLVFCGNMAYAPNVDAACYLVNDVMPLVWKEHPNANLLLAGAAPKHLVKSLASKRVVVSGSLQDIRSAYASARLFVAPMRIGSGLQNKLLEAMAMRLPCVTTSVANAALGATPGEQLLIGDSPVQLAACIGQLLDSKVLRDRLAASGHEFVVKHFSWDAANKNLEQVLSDAINKHASHEEIQLEDE